MTVSLYHPLDCFGWCRVCWSETNSRCGTAGVRCANLLPEPPECCDYSCAGPRPSEKVYLYLMRWPRRRQLHHCRWKGAGPRSAQTSPHPHWCSVRWRIATAPDYGELGLGNRKQTRFLSTAVTPLSCGLFLSNVALSGFPRLTRNSSSVDLFSLSDGRLNGQSRRKWQKEVSDLYLPLTTGPSHHCIPFPGSLQRANTFTFWFLQKGLPHFQIDGSFCPVSHGYREHNLKTVYVGVEPGVPIGLSLSTDWSINP